MDQQPAYCIATVTCDSFLPGTLVMLDSFLAHNAWFAGDIVIIHDELGESAQRTLSESFPNVIFRNPGADLMLRLDALVQAVPALRGQLLQFASLEAASLSKYDKVLFCDSDLLFRAPVIDLFQRTDKLLCSGDGPFQRGNARHKDSFAEVPLMSPQLQGQLQKTFNSGFMVLDSQVLMQKNYEAMLAMITPGRWENDRTGHTDQLVYNTVFAGQQTLISPVYNYTLLHRRDIFKATGKTLNDAAIIHYNGSAKPWIPAEFLKHARLDPAFIPALEFWNAAYIAYLTRINLSGIPNG